MFIFSVVPPVIVTALDHIALEGSNLTLFCNATGNSQPDIAWTKGDSNVLSSTETLYLINLRREDNGAVYSCKANNSLGFYTVSASITVMCEYTCMKNCVTVCSSLHFSALHFVIKSSLKSTIVNH